MLLLLLLLLRQRTRLFATALQLGPVSTRIHALGKVPCQIVHIKVQRQAHDQHAAARCDPICQLHHRAVANCKVLDVLGLHVLRSSPRRVHDDDVLLQLLAQLDIVAMVHRHRLLRHAAHGEIVLQLRHAAAIQLDSVDAREVGGKADRQAAGACKRISHADVTPDNGRRLRVQLLALLGLQHLLAVVREDRARINQISRVCLDGCGRRQL